MKAVDTNILVYAFHADFEQHPTALKILKELIGQGEAWGIPSPCIHEFLSKVTRKSYLSNPARMTDAISFIEVLLERYGAFILDESVRHFQSLAEILLQSGVTGAKVHDARIAAICRDHGIRELLTADRDFSYFPWLNSRNPLIG